MSDLKLELHHALDWLPDLEREAYKQLKASVIRDGCREPIAYWPHQGKNYIVDGKHRLSICQRHEVAYSTVKMEFKDFAEAIAWQAQNQEGRRNLSKEVLSLARGKAMQAVAPEKRGPDSGPPAPQSGAETVSANPPKSGGRRAAAKRIAEQHGVSDRTVFSDKKLADAFDKCGKSIQEAYKRSELTAAQLKKAATIPVEKHGQLAKKVRDGKTWDEVLPAKAPKKSSRPKKTDDERVEEYKQTIEESVNSEATKISPCPLCRGTNTIQLDTRLPKALQTEEFHEAWAKWLVYCGQKGKKAPTMTKAEQLKKLSALGPQKATRSVMNSISNNWTGVGYDPDEKISKTKANERAKGMY